MAHVVSRSYCCGDRRYCRASWVVTSKAFHALIFGAVLGGLLAFPSTARAQLTPETPEVRAAVDRGLEFLSTVEIPNESLRPIHEQVGADCLVGLALVKGHQDPDGNKANKRVLKAVASARSAIGSSEFANGYGRVYSSSIAIIFLCALDDKTYRSEITQLLNLLLSFQEPNGGYRDTSMSQYATLAMWEAGKHGFRVPAQSWQQVSRFWTTGQTQDGEYAYRPGVDAAIRPTLSMGGLGCLYICYVTGSKAREESPEKKQDAGNGGVAGALKPVGADEEEEDDRPQQISLNLNELRSSISSGDAWYRKYGNTAPVNYKYYFYYGVERYQAFREIYQNRFEDSPAWYNEIAQKLLDEQAEDGSWKSSADGRHPGLVGTSYAILVLIRSTKMRPQAMGDGRLVGGRGIPNLEADVEVKNGRIRIRALQGPAEELIKIISDPQNAQYYEALAGLEELAAGSDDAQLSKHLVRLRELAEGADPKAKAAAITAIARARSLDDVPFLIYTLNDESPDVVLAANDGLRFISRKLTSFTLPAEPTPSERAEAIEKWKKWYLSIRPDAVFDR